MTDGSDDIDDTSPDDQSASTPDGDVENRAATNDEFVDAADAFMDDQPPVEDDECDDDSDIGDGDDDEDVNYDRWTLEDIEDSFHESTYRAVQREELAHLTLTQRLVYLLTARSLAGIAEERREQGKVGQFFTIPLLAIIIYWMTWACMAIGYYLTHWLLGTGTDWVLYFLGLFIPFIAFSMKKEEESRRIYMLTDGGESFQERFVLGHLENIGRQDAVSNMAVCIAMIAGAQAALIQYSSNHLGIPNVDGAWTAGLITLDNFSRAAFLDLFDIYGIWFAEPIEHSIWSATVFFLFRCGMGAAVAYAVYSFFASFRLMRLLRRVPRRELQLPELLEWLDRIRGSHWSRVFPDEYVFLLAVQEYLQGSYDGVRALTERYPRLQVADYTRRRIFTDEEGQSVFGGYRQHGAS